MVFLQKEFLTFHDNIKLGTYDENEILRSKRDLLLSELKEALKNTSIVNTNKKLTFSSISQGSYAMNTGILPKNNDYDIDVGIVFDISDSDYKPVELKKLIHDILDKVPNRTVSIRRACVTVFYKNDGFHVDLAIYAACSGSYKIAKGKENSLAENKYWEDSDPQGLINWIGSSSTIAEEREQFRRLVRYLKAWKENKFSSFKPPSIGLTALVRKAFIFNKDQDITSLINIVSNIKSQFYPFYDSNDNNKLKYKINCYLAVSPYKDIFENLRPNQSNDFYNKISDLLEALETANNEDDSEEASKILTKVFGYKFPVIEKPEVAKQLSKPYVSTGKNA